MKFTERELEVIGHALNTLYEQVKEMYENSEGDEEQELLEYLYEINDIQTRITDNMPKETLN